MCCRGMREERQAEPSSIRARSPRPLEFSSSRSSNQLAQRSPGTPRERNAGKPSQEPRGIATVNGPGWEASAAAWTRFVDEGDLNRTYLLDPVMLGLCGEVSGQLVLDVGCGEGR